LQKTAENHHSGGLLTIDGALVIHTMKERVDYGCYLSPGLVKIKFFLAPDCMGDFSLFITFSEHLEEKVFCVCNSMLGFIFLLDGEWFINQWRTAHYIS